MEFVLDWFEKLKGLLLDKWLEHSIYFFFFSSEKPDVEMCLL